MNPEEYENLEKLSGEHWFYRGKRRIARHWIRRAGPPPGLLAEAGCGTGHFLAEWPGPSVGYDPSSRAVALAQRRARAFQSPAERLPLKDGEAAVVAAMDVLEHIQDDRAALAEMLRVLAPGGVLFATVPALPALWSDWDVSLGHHRRYTRPALKALVPPGVKLLRLAYFNEWSLLPAAAARVGRKWMGESGPRLEDWIPPAPLNIGMENLFVGSACLPFYRPPLGTSLMLLLRKAT